jgi:hypothetical protein
MKRQLPVSLVCSLLLPGCSYFQPTATRIVAYAHKAAEEYCKSPESVRLEVRKQFTAKEMTGPWVQVNCEAL